MASLARLNATIPQPLNDFADSRVKTGNFGNKSEYIRHLIRQDWANTRENQVILLNQMIQEGIDSSISDMTPDELKAEMQATIKQAVADRENA